MLKIETEKSNPVLRSKSKPVEKITPDILKLVGEMKSTLKLAENGVGLAAPQIGRNIRLFVVLDEIAKDGRTVFINPEITQISKTLAAEEEGCLSLPGQWHELARTDKVTIKALDEHGHKFKIRVKGLLARLMAHEVDHLNGILFTDHLKSKSKKRK
ncbi:MAG: peptide deformylase [Patescibacteria group bacterium]